MRERGICKQSDMETIIGLLIVIVPLVFRLIGRKLEQAGQQPGPEVEHVEDWAEVLRRHVELQQAAAADSVTPQEQEDVLPKAKKKTKTEATKAPKVSKPVFLEESPKKKEKIDVKKMIVYSEIMKPKYTE